MGLRLLHLSDIHFRTFDGYDFKDLDADIRIELEHDLRTLRKHYGHVDLTLIGGDIAFSGRKDEYDKADEWIKTISKITGCREDFVFTIPGNHDVERGKISHLVGNTHRLLKQCGNNRNAIDAELQGYLKSSDIEFILKPFENYHNFALRFGSIPEKGNLLFWEKLFELDGLKLRIRGVNSAIASNANDHQEKAKLVLGTHQGLMHRQSGVINVILCHHPPDWLCDGAKAQNEFNNRARIHLFGHKHVFEANIVENRCLVLAAGAMQPERNDSKWEPTYNIIDLSIERDSNGSALLINLYRRIWDKGTGKFGPDITKEVKVYESYKLPLDEFESEIVEVVNPKTEPESTEESMSEKIIDINDPNHLRRLAYLFLGLPYHMRLGIAVMLELVAETDEELTDLQKAQEYFKRAVVQNKQMEMWDLVMNHLSDKETNPFKR